MLSDVSCGKCRLCLDDPSKGIFENPVNALLILCPSCGNKRCPHATDHRFACTNSNEPNQYGSCYGDMPIDERKVRRLISSWCIDALDHRDEAYDLRASGLAALADQALVKMEMCLSHAQSLADALLVTPFDVRKEEHDET